MGFESHLAAWGLISLFLLLIGCHGTEVPAPINYADCLSCHRGIERIGAGHDMACVACHVLPEVRSAAVFADHDAIIRNPSDPLYVKAFCLPCHEREIYRVFNSIHATMAGIINQTRYLWGAQVDADPAVYGLSGPFRRLPDPDPHAYPETPRLLVDDFLRRRCLRCHLHQEGPPGRGLYRASGCAACHMIYNDDGLYKGADKALDPTQPGYPVQHRFTRNIPDEQCLHCHNHNHVGADYHGLFEHDYSSTYRSGGPAQGEPPLVTHGLDQHHLAADVHAEKGLWCIDCHTDEDVMGDGNAYGFQMAVPKPTCADCHGGFEKGAPNPLTEGIEGTLAGVLPEERRGMGKAETQDTGVVFVSKNRGERHPLPLFSRRSPAHDVSAHRRLRCSACHAQWTYQDYGLSVIRMDRIGDGHWGHLTAQGDPYLQGVLEAYLRGQWAGDPVTKDRVSGEERLGIWLQGWRFRRWEPMPLGVDHQGKVALLRPHYQFFITYVDRAGNVPLDSVVPSRGDRTGVGWSFMPHVPHTIAPAGRWCDSCHQGRVAAGLGMDDAPTKDTWLTVPSPPAVPTMRLLNVEERERLMEPSVEWSRRRLEAIEGGK